MGDAAHAMVPWQAAGVGQAIEDAQILETLLGCCTRGRSQVPAALKAYDKCRRPRTQAVSDSSRDMEKLLTGKVDGVGLDPEKLNAALQGKWDLIHNVDLDKQQEEAVRAMQEFESGGY